MVFSLLLKGTLYAERTKKVPSGEEGRKGGKGKPGRNFQEAAGTLKL